MSSAKLNTAQKLVKQKKYNEARAILLKLDDPAAQKLIYQIDQEVVRDLQREGLAIAPPKQQAKGKGRFRLVSPLGCLAMVVICSVMAVYGANAPKPTPTATPLPSATPTPSNTPTITDTPTITLTPSITPTLSATDLALLKIANMTATREQINANRTATADSLYATRTQLANDRALTAWAYQMTLTYMAENRPVATRVPVQAPPTLPPQQGSCPSTSYTCAQLTCAEAYACLAAGARHLDRDGDGKPCEDKCGG